MQYDLDLFRCINRILDMKEPFRIKASTVTGTIL